MTRQSLPNLPTKVFTHPERVTRWDLLGGVADAEDGARAQPMKTPVKGPRGGIWDWIEELHSTPTR